MYKIYLRKTTKILIKKIKEELINGEIVHVYDRKIQYYKDVGSPQVDLQISCNPNENYSELLCGYQQNDCKVYMEMQKTQNSQYNIQGKQCSTDTT